MTIVVTGATGNVGRPLVTALLAAGAPVRAVTRRSGPAGFPAQVELFDTAADALPGASAVFLNARALGGQLEDVVARQRAAGSRNWLRCRRSTPTTTSPASRPDFAATATGR